jgi:hypothetical protein
MKRFASPFVIALALAACKEPAPKSEPPTGAPKPFRAGIVFDVGGIDDKSFNEAATPQKTPALLAFIPWFSRPFLARIWPISWSERPEP